MQYYYFNGGDHIELGRMTKLEDCGFTGALFIFNAWSFEYFTKIARDIDTSKKIKYMVALRPYHISPQYLNMIQQSINSIMPERVQVNFISGHIKPHEVLLGRTTMPHLVHDLSSNIERSQYMIDYLGELQYKLKDGTIHRAHQIDAFVTTSNQFVYDAAVKYHYPMIIGYTDYLKKKWYHGNDWGSRVNLKDKGIMISISPVIVETQEELEALPEKKSGRDIEYFTFEGFQTFITELLSQGIKHIMLSPNADINGDDSNIIETVKKLTNK